MRLGLSRLRIAKDGDWPGLAAIGRLAVGWGVVVSNPPTVCRAERDKPSADLKRPLPTQPPSGQWRPIPANRHLSRFSTDSTPAASNPKPTHDLTLAPHPSLRPAEAL